MTVDWTLIGNWIVQGLIFAGFAFLGVYAGLRLFGRAATAPAPSAAPVSRPTAAPIAAAPPPLVLATLPAAAAGVAAAPETPEVRHAIEFAEDRLTIILEGPTSLLADDHALVAAWVDVVGWARLDYLGRGAQRTSGPDPALALAAGRPAALSLNEPAAMQAQLDQVLQRLHLSAERRRQLRALLEQSFLPSPEEI